MGTFRFNKQLPADASNLNGQLESLFDIVFEQMIYFREELDRHTGKAASALQEKMDDHIVFFGKAMSSLLYFADNVKGFVMTIEGQGTVPGT